MKDCQLQPIRHRDRPDPARCGPLFFSYDKPIKVRLLQSSCEERRKASMRSRAYRSECIQESPSNPCRTVFFPPYFRFNLKASQNCIKYKSNLLGTINGTFAIQWNVAVQRNTGRQLEVQRHRLDSRVRRSSAERDVCGGNPGLHDPFTRFVVWDCNNLGWFAVHEIATILIEIHSVRYIQGGCPVCQCPLSRILCGTIKRQRQTLIIATTQLRSIVAIKIKSFTWLKIPRSVSALPSRSPNINNVWCTFVAIFSIDSRTLPVGCS